MGRQIQRYKRERERERVGERGKGNLDGWIERWGAREQIVQEYKVVKINTAYLEFCLVR